MSNNSGCFSSYTRKLAVSLYSFGTTPLQHLTTIAQNQKKPFEAPQESELPSSTKKAYNNNNNNNNNNTNTTKEKKQKPDNILQQQHCYLLQNIPNFQIK
jgi:hypothetical protein